MSLPPPRPPARRRRRQRPGADPGPRPVGESLDAVVAKLDSSGNAGTLAGVFTRWSEIVGPGLAEHVEPVRLAGGVLSVAADHPAWATQVRSLGGDLLARVGEIAGEVPTRLEVTVRRS